jgi:carbon starvation protein
MPALKPVLWRFLAILGSVALAFVDGLVNPQEKVNGLWLVVAASCLFRPARITA